VLRNVITFEEDLLVGNAFPWPITERLQGISAISSVLYVFHVKPSARAKVVRILEFLRIVIGSPLVNSHYCVLRDIVPADIGSTLWNEGGQSSWKRGIYSQRLMRTGFQAAHVVNQIQIRVALRISRQSFNRTRGLDKM